MAHVQVQLPAVAMSLWECRQKPWQSHVGFAKPFTRQIQTQGWNWISPDLLQTIGSFEVVLSSLLTDGLDGERAKHQFRDILRQIWWAEWAPLRPCLQGAEVGVDRVFSLRLVHHMRKGHFDFGNDGTKGARYRRLLANAMWSGTRLRHVNKVTCALCRVCRASGESTVRIFWECVSNTPARIAFAQQWDGTCEPFQYSQLPPSLYACGEVPLGTSLTTVQIALIQKYLSSILMRWDPSRFGVHVIDISEQ